MRFEVTAAWAIGILLPVLETLRRGVREWAIDFTTMFEDYVEGRAEAMMAVFKAQSSLCYVGRDNKRPNRSAYVQGYWK